MRSTGRPKLKRNQYKVPMVFDAEQKEISTKNSAASAFAAIDE